MKGYVVVFEGDDESGYSAYSLTCRESSQLGTRARKPRR
jgi:hypothetical protein